MTPGSEGHSIGTLLPGSPQRMGRPATISATEVPSRQSRLAGKAAGGRKGGRWQVLVAVAAAGWLLTMAGSAAAADIDWAKVDHALGKVGTDQPDGVRKYGLPRSDLHVTLDGVALKPAFALGGWLAFEPMESAAIVMGDLVLAEREVNPVMSRLLAHGIVITAVHNHLLHAVPATFYMHIAGRGDPVRLAQALHDALRAGSGTPLDTAVPPPAPASLSALPIDTARLDRILGYRGKRNGGVYQFAIPRADTIREQGMILPPAMGTAIGINFQPTGQDQAAITGDLALIAVEVVPVQSALRRAGIKVTALHNHMLDEQPRLFFVHFWARGEAVRLAEGMRAALDHVNATKE